MLKMTRRVIGAALAAAAFAATSGAAHAQGGGRNADAERFVQSGAQRVISILASNSSDAQKEATFRQAINDLADVPKITNFVLGKYARTITPDQRARFAAAFRAYAERVYRNRLDDYHGESVKVTGSLVRKPGDVIVSTTISGGKITKPETVSWRVMGAGASWKAVDVQFRGVWLAITQQQDIVSSIDNAHGNIDTVIAQLQRDAQRPLPKS